MTHKIRNEFQNKSRSSRKTHRIDSFKFQLQKPINYFLFDRLKYSLSRPVRKYCVFEWFYSDVDAIYFAKNDFKTYLKKQNKFPNGLALSRFEWSKLRTGLGKPRRFSSNFISEEHRKLNIYRKLFRKLATTKNGEHLLIPNGSYVVVNLQGEIYPGVVKKHRIVNNKISYLVSFEDSNMSNKFVKDTKIMSMSGKQRKISSKFENDHNYSQLMNSLDILIRQEQNSQSSSKEKEPVDEK
ncbi:lin-9 [Anaeramoeba flamelloides]|uniref:Lin-9 n=1 Tax=Anaeramoeba flamelloides TaxID=1746091 RepID=A0AAV7ZA94_9EUKA|nr:lin-9 [Anaeramoeba flamelloides]